MKIVLASGNKAKIKEFQELLAPINLTIVPQAELGVEDAEETGLSFVENALIKARHAAKQTGLPAIADDSGLVVAALKGAPGIYSSRYAGKHGDAKANIDKLLTDMQNVPNEHRDAFFYCSLVLIHHELDPTPIICEGEWHGRILRKPSGTHGFGYDPVFHVPEKNVSAAKLASDVKNQISHRGIALRSLLDALPEKV